VIWVQDYHLMLQGKLLSERVDRRNLIYFHHIPFPPPDVFEKLPWRKDILEGLLGFGLVGFQSTRDRHNFLACVRRLFSGSTLRKTGATLNVIHGSNETTVGTFPIGIDFEDFNQTAMQPRVISKAETIRRDRRDRCIVLGVDRLDYTKGILERIKAFGVLLERYSGLHGQISLIQIAVPSREDIPHYRNLKELLEELVSEINSRFARPGWVPIEYFHRHFSRAELVAFYRAADIALITPVKDGMNLVCKEFCATRADDSGVLMLSEFAGAANQLKTGALLVNPYDTEGIASSLYRAFDMDQRDVRRRMRRMRRSVRTEDVYDWCRRILSASGSFLALDKVNASFAESSSHDSNANFSNAALGAGESLKMENA
jgi:trehalose 6-phosphate synthase